MKVVIAIDSFKGSISSPDAGAAIREGIHRVFPDAEVFVRPLADGGEGTVEALVSGKNGSLRSLTVTGPLGAPVTACDTIRGGVSLALEQAGPGGTVLCYGSLYLIGDVETQLRDLKKS